MGIFRPPPVRPAELAASLVEPPALGRRSRRPRPRPSCAAPAGRTPQAAACRSSSGLEPAQAVEGRQGHRRDGGLVAGLELDRQPRAGGPAHRHPDPGRASLDREVRARPPRGGRCRTDPCPPPGTAEPPWRPGSAGTPGPTTPPRTCAARTLQRQRRTWAARSRRCRLGRVARSRPPSSPMIPRDLHLERVVARRRTRCVGQPRATHTASIPACLPEQLLVRTAQGPGRRRAAPAPPPRPSAAADRSSALPR